MYQCNRFYEEVIQQDLLLKHPFVPTINHKDCVQNVLLSFHIKGKGNNFDIVKAVWILKALTGGMRPIVRKDGNFGYTLKLRIDQGAGMDYFFNNMLKYLDRG